MKKRVIGFRVSVFGYWGGGGERGLRAFRVFGWVFGAFRVFGGFRA